MLFGFVIAAILLPKDRGQQAEQTPTGTEAAQVETVTKQVRVTAAERRAVNRTLVAFIRSGVTFFRRHGWKLW